MLGIPTTKEHPIQSNAGPGYTDKVMKIKVVVITREDSFQAVPAAASAKHECRVGAAVREHPVGPNKRERCCNYL